MRKLFGLLCAGAIVCASVLMFACGEGEEQQPMARQIQTEDVLITKSDAGIIDTDFCQHADLENIGKTIPLVNRFLDVLNRAEEPGNEPGREPDRERMAQALVLFFKSFPCVLDARTLPDGRQRMTEVAFSFIDNGTARELTLDFSSTHKVLSYHYDVAKGASVKTKNGFTIDRIFDFINSIELDVERVYRGVYVSSMPAGESNLQKILKALNAKPYTHDEVWQVTGYLHYQTGQITIFPYLFEIKNKEYQADWLRAMKDYRLTEDFSYDHSGHIVDFVIEEDSTTPQSRWEDMFDDYEFVEWAEINCNRYTILDKSMGTGDVDATPAVDSKITLRLAQASDAPSSQYLPGSLQLFCATEKEYPSGSNPLITTSQQASGRIDIAFKGVAEIGMTDDIGPARAIVDLGELADGEYELNLYNGDVKRSGWLKVSAESYSVEFAGDDLFGFSEKLLKRIP